MNNYQKHAWNEFRAAGWVTSEGDFVDEMQKMICTHVLKLLDVFDGGGHSGSTASYTIGLFEKLAKFEPIMPLTGEDWEWTDISEQSGRPLWQNKRCSHVFKDENGAYDIDGIVFYENIVDESGITFKRYFTSRDSRVPVTFPYTPTTEYKECVL